MFTTNSREMAATRKRDPMVTRLRIRFTPIRAISTYFDLIKALQKIIHPLFQLCRLCELRVKKSSYIRFPTRPCLAPTPIRVHSRLPLPRNPPFAAFAPFLSGIMSGIALRKSDDRSSSAERRRVHSRLLRLRNPASRSSLATRLSRHPIVPTPAPFCTLHSKLCTQMFLADPRCSLLILANPR